MTACSRFFYGALCALYFLCALTAPCHAEEATAQIPVVAEGRLAGFVDAVQTPEGHVHIKAEGLSAWVNSRMNETAAAAFAVLSARGGFVPPDDFASAGLSIVYDDFDAVLRLTPDPAQLRRMEISVKSPQVTPDDSVVMPAALSAYVNLRGGVEYVSGTDAAGDGRQPARVDIDGAIHWRGTVLEAQADYLENDSDAFRRGDIRLVRDFPAQMLRAAVGDLSYPVTSFQSFQPMLGVSLARNFTLQPYRVTTPTGDTSFVVQSPARVDILVNGQRIRSLRLDPGSYDISDFPVADGANDVSLVITDATGNVEVKRFPLLGDRQLLKQGLHAYAYSAGIRADKGGRDIEYDAGAPVFSGFHRYGVSETLTLGAQAQGDQDVQQVGLSALKATALGTFGLDAAASRTRRAGADAAVQLSYRLADVTARRDFSAQLRWRGDDFAALGQPNPVNPSAAEAAARYNFMLGEAVTAGIGWRYRFGRGSGEDDWSYAFTAGRSFQKGLTLSLNAEHRRQEGIGAFVTLTWSPPSSPHSFQAVSDTFAQTQEARWDYRPPQDIGAPQAYAALLRQDGGGAQATGGIAYRGYRGEASLRHDIYRDMDGRSEERSQLLAGAALAYAEGQLALSRPVSGSFVMLRRHETLDAGAIGINPSVAQNRHEKDAFRARIDAFGPAVLPDATPYMYYPVRIDTRFLPVGYDIGRDLYTVFPSYRSGAVLTVGHAGNIYAEGRIIDGSGVPAALMGGEIRPLAGGAPQEFFTNAEGFFNITGLAPGRYVLTLHRLPRRAVYLDIPAGAPVGLYAAGDLYLPAPQDSGGG